MTDLQFRDATESDIPRIAEIFREARLLAYDGVVPLDEIANSSGPEDARWQELLADEAVSFLVAERNGQVLAMAVVSGKMLKSLHVDPATHGGGIGRAFLAHCRTITGPGMELNCVVGNDRAAAFYEKAGMQRAGIVEQKIYDKIYPAHRFVFED